MKIAARADHRGMIRGPARTAASLGVALAPALAAAALIAGCGGSTAATLDPVAQAAETTMRAGGAQLSLVAKIEGAALPSALMMQGHGTFNMSRQEGQLTAGFQGLPAQAAQQFPGGKLEMTELFARQAIYITAPFFAGRLPNGAKWIRLDISKLRSKLGIDVQSLSSGQSNPAEVLTYMRGQGASITRLGREDVRGTPATHYRGTIDLAREAETLPTKDRAALKAAMQKMIATSGIGKMPVELWIDDHHLMRKMTLDISGQQGVRANMTIELFGFGPTPVVTPPPVDQAYDATSSLFGGAIGG